jgi:uncharacterized protein (TIGR01777 family)
MRVLVSGSTGLIGSELIRQLRERGDEAIPLVHRRDEKGVYWDLNRFRVNPDDFERFDAIVHLAGESIGERRLTESRKRSVWDSRIVTTEYLNQTIDKVTIKPKTLIVASAVGYYGSQGDQFLTEQSPKGSGFFAELSDNWEKMAREAEKHDIRVVNLRSGVVLDKNGGALARQLPMFKLFMGGRLGSGHQWMSWISLQDEVRAIMHILDTPSLSGPVNLTSPEPVTNGAYTHTLALVLGRVAIVPTPPALLKLALGETLAEELLLTSQRVIPQKLLDSGFQFELPYLKDALEFALREPPEEDEESEDESTDPEAPKKP